MPVEVLRLRHQGRRAARALPGRQRPPPQGQRRLADDRPDRRGARPAPHRRRGAQPAAAALVSLLVYNGLRIAEVLACDVDAFTHQRGHRVLRIVAQGRQGLDRAARADHAPRARGLHRRARAAGPIFLNADGDERLSYSTSYAMIRRLARRAGIDAPIGSARTACATASRPSCSAPASRSRTCRTRWGTPTPGRRGRMTAPATTSTATRPTRWPRTSTALRPASQPRIRQRPRSRSERGPTGSQGSQLLPAE